MELDSSRVHPSAVLALAFSQLTVEAGSWSVGIDVSMTLLYVAWMPSSSLGPKLSEKGATIASIPPAVSLGVEMVMLGIEGPEPPEEPGLAPVPLLASLGQ